MLCRLTANIMRGVSVCIRNSYMLDFRADRVSNRGTRKWQL